MSTNLVFSLIHFPSISSSFPPLFFTDEIARLNRIAENHLHLQQIGVVDAAVAIRNEANRTKQNKSNKRKINKTASNAKKTAAATKFKQRCSKRTKGNVSINYSQDIIKTNFEFYDGDENLVVRAETMYGTGQGLHKGQHAGKRTSKKQLAPSDFSLPEDWKIFETKRKGGATKGRSDRYYQPPNANVWLRSLAEVYRYINVEKE